MSAQEQPTQEPILLNTAHAHGPKCLSPPPPQTVRTLASLSFHDRNAAPDLRGPCLLRTDPHTAPTLLHGRGPPRPHSLRSEIPHSCAPGPPHSRAADYRPRASGRPPPFVPTSNALCHRRSPRLRPSIKLIKSGSSASWRRWVQGGGSPLLLIPPPLDAIPYCSSIRLWTRTSSRCSASMCPSRYDLSHPLCLSCY
jgi:hypothetical protein